RILRRHVLPNCFAPLIVQLSFVFAYAVLSEAVLSFLGLGAPPTVPSWGILIAEGRGYIREAPWLTAFPGVAIAITVLGLNLLGEDPLAVERLWDKLYIGSAYYGRRGIAMHCISALDNCLWSIRAQATGQSIASLLGGRRRDRVTAYASTLFRETPEGMAQAA